MSSPSNVLYRVATSLDVPIMVRGRLADPNAGPPDERMAAYLDGRHHPQDALPPRIAFVALAGASAIGYTAGHLTRRFKCDGELQYLFVVSAYRRRGIAVQLVRRLRDWFTEHAAKRVCVNVDADSPGARPFYATLGAADLRPHWMAWHDIGTQVQTAEHA